MMRIQSQHILSSDKVGRRCLAMKSICVILVLVVTTNVALPAPGPQGSRAEPDARTLPLKDGQQVRIQHWKSPLPISQSLTAEEDKSVSLTTWLLINAGIGAAKSGIYYTVTHWEDWDGYDFAGSVTVGALSGVGSAVIDLFGAGAVAQWLNIAVEEVTGVKVGKALSTHISNFFRSSVQHITSWRDAVFGSISDGVTDDPDQFGALLTFA